MLHRYFQPGGTPVAAVRSTGPRERFPAPNISDLIPQYLKGKLADVQRIQDALERGDFDTVRVIGHNIKGTGNGYGFPEITEIGRNLEAAAKEQTASTIRSEVKALAELLERLLNTIPRYGSPTVRDGCNAR
jgi:HPt (histidine-containing phosphotransfer) domain-containing protein